MTNNRITFYTFIFLLIVGLVLLIFYSVTEDTANSLEQISEVNADINTPPPQTIISAPEVATEKIETPNLETQASSSLPKIIPKSEAKIQDLKIAKPVAETPTTKLTFEPSRILSAHNITRKEANITPLTYSKTLADSAQKWSEELQRDKCEMRHDPNTDYGENLYWASQTGGELKNELIATPETVVGYWAEEKTDYNYTKNSCAPGKQCGHYTQIVWAETTQVGCGVSVCQNGDTQKEIWVCRYNPRGNYFGEKPY